MLFLVGLMHSALGGPQLIAPILKRGDMPVILGNVQNSRLTLLIGWHALTLVFWAQAAVLLAYAYDPALLQSAVLFSVAVPSGILGLAAVILSRGRHLSWAFFLPLAAMTGTMGWTGWV